MTFFYAEEYFEAVSRLVILARSNARSRFSEVSLRYSTPAEYFSSVFSNDNKQNDSGSESTSAKKLLLFDQDYFPYMQGDLDILTGYFSSQPAIKQAIRNLGIFTRAIQSFNSLFQTKKAFREPRTLLENSML